MTTRIERLRLARGWSQTEMGAYLGVTQSNVSRIETGEQSESGSLSKLLDLLEAETAADAPAPSSNEATTASSGDGAGVSASREDAR